MASSSMFKRPHDNTYWVEPGKLLAGEYPALPALNRANPRLGRYLDCGVNSFIDLTQEWELESYETALQQLAAQRGLTVKYRRMSIPDMGVPSSPATMRGILQAIRDDIAEGATVYVHCWAGVGRTGTVIGSYLAEREHSSDLAMRCLATLWQQMEKRFRFPYSPQTDEQLKWVKDWLKISR